MFNNGSYVDLRCFLIIYKLQWSTVVSFLHGLEWLLIISVWIWIFLWSYLKFSDVLSDDAKGSDILLEAILESETAHQAKHFFAQPENQIKSQ